jgi:peroxiredoxin
VVALLLLAGCGCAVADPLRGAPCPDFALFDVQNRQVKLADIREPVIVLNCFAFWCNTWIAQLPQLRELAAQQSRLHFKLLSVSVDGVWTDQLQAVCGGNPVPYPVLIDRGSRLSRALRVRHVPTVLILNRGRKIVWVHEAYPGNIKVLEAIRRAGAAEVDSGE